MILLAVTTRTTMMSTIPGTYLRSSRCRMTATNRVISSFSDSTSSSVMRSTYPLRKNSFSTLPVSDDDDLENSVPWFPKHRSEIDRIIHRTIQASTTSTTTTTNDDSGSPTDPTVVTLSSDHPGFHDPIYRQRRTQLAQYASQYQWDDNGNIPKIRYTPEETHVWTTVYNKIQPLIQEHACKEYKKAIHDMETIGLYSSTMIPQQCYIYNYLYNQTQFRLRPVTGLLQSRDFLNALALRIFCCTQYIRHASQPYYTPEPDICHELLGHVPLLCHPTFANLSQQIGIASVGASDDDIALLSKCYWHSVEFGLCYDTDSDDTNQKQKCIKAYGAGLLSSFGELEYACGGKGSMINNDTDNNNTGIEAQQSEKRPMYHKWDPVIACQQSYPITEYQPIYYVADSILDALHRLQDYCTTHIESKKSFIVQYNPITERIDVTMK